MKSIISLLEGLQIRLKLAQNTGNLELASAIQCAQGNANAQAQHVMGSLEPVGVLLDLAGTMFDIVGDAGDQTAGGRIANRLGEPQCARPGRAGGR